ncbi:MAG: DUF5018 domain-containing protein [Bacteroidales bacterium]|nr:DUF5018 domain-containing protein [Bacteroidales bacterium]
MKKIYFLIVLALAAVSCHQPEYVAPTANRQGLTSLSAIITDGIYAEQELGRLMVTDPEADLFEIPIPYFYPESSNDETLIYMMELRVQAELQPNWKISPRLGVLDLTEETEFTLTDPFGNSRQIRITGKREKSSKCSLLSLMVDEVKTSCVIYENDDKILIPYLEDLSSVHIIGQVVPHAKITKVNGKDYNEKAKYNMNTGATITVTAHNGTTTKTYNVEQGIPTLMGQGLRPESVSLLCNVDPVTMVGLPAYDNKCYVSLAGIDSQILVGIGEGRAPFIVDAFTGAKKGEMVLGSAVADCITNDDAGHVLLCNYADGGDAAGTVNVWMTSSPTEAPVLWHSFTNPLHFPIGHRMKVIGDITGDAVVVFTSEGIVGVSVASEIAWLKVEGGAVTGTFTKDFSGLGLAWGAAPVNFATVVPASVHPDKDGWFLDYYEGNVDPSVAHGSGDCYILHYIDGGDKDNWVELMGNWSINPNCLDAKTFNHGRFMALLGVSHFPEWEIKPRLHFFEVTEPTAATPLLKNDAITIFQKGATDPDVGAAGDVALVPSKDGYRLYVYYYDHHAQAIGAYVADCFEI